MIQRKTDIERLQDNAADAAALLQAVGNPHRLLVLCLLIGEGEMSVGALNEQVALSPSALSQHLARMRDEGLIDSERDAQRIHYFITHPAVQQVINTLKTLYCP